MSDIKNNIETVNEVFTKFLEKRGFRKTHRKICDSKRGI